MLQQDETEGVCCYHVWRVECGDHQAISTSGEMAMDDHCRMDDDPPIYGMCPLRLRTPDT